MTRTETLTIIWPRAAMVDMNAERRMHHHQRAKLVKAIRAETHAAAVDIPAFDGPVTVTARFQWGDNHRRDTSNLFPTVKAAVDGLTDAGVIPGDHDAIVRDTAIGVEMPPNPALKGYGRMVLSITEMAAEMVGSEHNNKAARAVCANTPLVPGLTPTEEGLVTHPSNVRPGGPTR